MKASLRLLTIFSTLAIVGLVQTQNVRSAAFGLPTTLSLSKPDYRSLASVNWHWGNTNSPLFRRVETLRQQQTPAGLQRVVKGGTFNAALTTGWTVLTWGQNNVGQLGIGTACPDCGSDVP
ncbi:MAG: hypothetical protein JWM68_3026, partial [Verrucomicrobiales bacterium]|nr:hypothetical protein [Verrucomicrobiales bacterium]